MNIIKSEGEYNMNLIKLAASLMLFTGIAKANTLQQLDLYTSSAQYRVTGRIGVAASTTTSTSLTTIMDGVIGISSTRPIATSSNITGAYYFGNGSNLTGVITSTTALALSTGTLVKKAGDTMTGQLTLSGSTLTINGGRIMVNGYSNPALNLQGNNVNNGGEIQFKNYNDTYSYNWILWDNPSANKLYLYRRGPAGAMVWTNTGYVGIGQIFSPTHALHVLGGIYASSSMTASEYYGDGSTLTGVIQATATGSYPLSITGTVPAASVSAGSLGGSVLASSITLSAMYGAPTLTGTNFTSIPNAALVTSVIPSSATGTYPLSISGNATTATTATTATSVPQSGVNLSTVTANHVLKSGDTMTGPLTVSGSSLTVAGQMDISSSTIRFVHSSLTPTASQPIGDVTHWTIGSYGVNNGYNWLQGWNGYPINLQPVGGSVGIGIRLPNGDGTHLLNVTNEDGLGAGDIYNSGVGAGIETTGSVIAGGTLTVTGNTFSVGGSTLVVTAGNVGVGTISPGSRLEVNGTSHFVGTATFAGATGEFGVKVSSNLFVVGYSSSSKYYGDGSNLTGQANSLRVSTATYLATAPGACGSGQFISALTADGTKTCGTPSGAGDVVLAATQTFTGGNTFASSSTFNGDLGIKTYKLAMSSVTINSTYDVGFSSSSEYWFALQSTTTLTFSSVGVGDEMLFYIEQSSNSKGITWPSYVDWGTAGVISLSTTTRKTDLVTVKCLSSAYCQAIGNKAGFTAP